MVVGLVLFSGIVASVVRGKGSTGGRSVLCWQKEFGEVFYVEHWNLHEKRWFYEFQNGKGLKRRWLEGLGDGYFRRYWRERKWT